MIAFVIYFHSSRIDNLLQTLRFLRKREPNLPYELILGCQDSITSHLPIVNLKLPTYARSTACNLLARRTECPLLVFLDSDRILPKHYFTETAHAMTRKMARTASFHCALAKPYADAQIEDGNVVFHRQRRSVNPVVWGRTAFSGNMMMWREDYWAIGGMDESYTGYGFNDNDFTMACLNHGINIVYNDCDEWHLFHERNLSEHDYWASNAKNALRFQRKWGVKPTGDSRWREYRPLN